MKRRQTAQALKARVVDRKRLEVAFADFMRDQMEQYKALSVQIATMARLLEKWEREGTPTARITD